MKKILILTIWVLLFLLINSCSATMHIVPDQKLRLSLQGGANLGGITENTDMTVVPGVRVPAESTVDAFSGATKLGYNIGVHTNKKLKKNQIETGLDYMYNYQTFTYIDAGNFYIGVRKLNVSQIMLPLTYNFVLFRSLMPRADIQLKVGLAGQLNLISTKDAGISLPSYTINHWSIGPIIGLSVNLFQFKNGNNLGFYFDVYRGNQIYEDYYNQSSFEIPGSSFMKFGLRYHFN